jgi:hypothetical protein
VTLQREHLASAAVGAAAALALSLVVGAVVLVCAVATCYNQGWHDGRTAGWNACAEFANEQRAGVRR